MSEFYWGRSESEIHLFMNGTLFENLQYCLRQVADEKTARLQDVDRSNVAWDQRTSVFVTDRRVSFYELYLKECQNTFLIDCGSFIVYFSDLYLLPFSISELLSALSLGLQSPCNVYQGSSQRFPSAVFSRIYIWCLKLLLHESQHWKLITPLPQVTLVWNLYKEVLISFVCRVVSSRLVPRNMKVKIYKAVILPAVLYERVTGFLALMEEWILGVSESWVLKRIFKSERGSNRRTEKNYRTRNFIICSIYKILLEWWDDEICESCSMHGTWRMQNSVKIWRVEITSKMSVQMGGCQTASLINRVWGYGLGSFGL
jgi:hypothetical protein